MRLNGALGKMAAGELDIEIPGANRGDEVGDMAKTVVVIRQNAEHKARAEADAKANQDQIAAKQRKADMIKLADDFENPRSAKSSRPYRRPRRSLEASATTLTATAERAQELTTGRWPAASEEASTNVQSVAVRDRRNGFLRQRDQPPGAGIGADGQRGGRSGPQDQ